MRNQVLGGGFTRHGHPALWDRGSGHWWSSRSHWSDALGCCSPRDKRYSLRPWGWESGPVPRRCLGPCKSRRGRPSLSQLLHAYYSELTPRSIILRLVGDDFSRKSPQHAYSCWTLFGKSWDHIGLILGHFGLGTFWATLAPKWDMLGHFKGTFCGWPAGLDKGKAACVARDEVNKCKSHPKIMKDSQNDFA